VASLLAGVVLCALALAGISGPAAAAISTHSSGKISAHLTKTIFKTSQAKSVKLIYSFSSKSKSFSYRLNFKKGSRWQLVTSVKKTGSFKGSKSITAKKLFAGKSVKVGSYRLKLSADKGSKALNFKLVSSTGKRPAHDFSPEISGTAKQGEKLSAWKGTWSKSPTSFAYQWRRCNSAGANCSNIKSASSSKYALVSADVGSTIRVVVTATNLYGSSSAASSRTAVVTGLPPANSDLPVISGTTTENQTLTTSTGNWSNSPTTFVYQWRRCDGLGANCADISGASANTYALVTADAGLTIRVVVTATNSSGSSSATSAPTAVITRVSPLSAEALGVGREHTCALVSGAVECWGDNSSGELGSGTTIDSSTPVPVSGISGATQIAAGDSHTCALLSGGSVKCWGDNSRRQLGDGVTDHGKTDPYGSDISPLPVQVSGISTATQLSAGGARTCALLSDSTVECWGDGSSTPLAASGVTNAREVGAGAIHTCALIFGGTVECWGSNGVGQLGDGTTTASAIPVAVSGIAGATQLSAGHAHSCALLGGGSIKCWGSNGSGQIGNGTTNTSEPYGIATPVQVSAITDATQVSAGWDHSCAVISGGTVECWGSNAVGQLGNGTTTASATPVQVSGITNAIRVNAGYSHTCALLVDGTIKCWGANGSGQLGDGTTTGSQAPVQVIGIP
jgi:alpha-tubulin suppressor-like RCC1 family protein